MAAVNACFRTDNTPDAIAAVLTAQSVTDTGNVQFIPYGPNSSKVTIVIIKK